MFLSWALKPLALVSTVAFSTLGLLSRRYQRARFFFHLTIYISTLGALSVWGVLVSVLATLAGQRLNINYYVARSFYNVCHPLIGIRFEVEGEEHLHNLLTARNGKPQSAVLVGNHQSFLDILYLGRIFPKRAAITAKQELKWSPLLGQYMALSGAVFIDRKNRKEAVGQMEKAGNDMKKKGVSLWIFPEGTRSLTAEPTLLPFKKGAFHLAIQAQVPIIAVVCENYHRLFDARTRMEQGRLRIKVLPPISTAGMTTEDVHTLSESTRDLMLRTLTSISAPSPSSLKSSTSDPKTSSPQTSAHVDLIAPKSNIMTTEQDTEVRQRQTPKTSGSESSTSTSLSSNESGVQLDKERKGLLSKVESIGGGETTEDEMDDDAVLMKRPKAE